MTNSKMNDIVVMLVQYYYPKGIIPDDYINKVCIYNKNDKNLEQKMYDDFVLKMDQMDGYYILYKDKSYAVNKENMRFIFKQIYNELNSSDINLIYNIKEKSQSNHYKLIIYSTYIR